LIYFLPSVNFPGAVYDWVLSHIFAVPGFITHYNHIQMKKFILILFLLPVMTCLGQNRVVEKSGKKPGWVNGLEKDYIIVVGTGASVQDAQRNALNMVKEDIVNAVAQNIKSTSNWSSQETSVNSSVTFFLEKFASTVTTSSGPVSYLQGITLAKVDEFYWEKIQDRNSRSFEFNYHIKYPFPNIELQKLVMDFKMRDRELSEQLDALLTGISQISSVEDIENKIGELRILSDYFIDARKDKAKLGITQYRNLYNQIELVEIGSSLGVLRYALRFGDRFISTNQRPQFMSDCARVRGTTTENMHIIIEYDYSNCYEDPENNILVRYRFGNTNIQKPFFFDITANKASIFVSEAIHFREVSARQNNIGSYMIDMTVVSRYDTPFTIEKVILEWPGKSPVVIDNIGQKFNGKGNHTLKLEVKGVVDLNDVSSQGKSISMLSGYIHFKSDRTGERKTYRILNHNYTTSW
jgi:hypothetical protein